MFHPLDDPEPSLDINFRILKFRPDHRPHPTLGTGIYALIHVYQLLQHFQHY